MFSLESLDFKQGLQVLAETPNRNKKWKRRRGKSLRKGMKGLEKVGVRSKIYPKKQKSYFHEESGGNKGKKSEKKTVKKEERGTGRLRGKPPCARLPRDRWGGHM